MQVETAGVPTVTLITEAFRVPASYRASTLGMPALRIVEMSHPLASKGPQEIDEDADRVLDLVIGGLQLEE